jgi:protein-disulfide isomerase
VENKGSTFMTKRFYILYLVPKEVILRLYIQNIAIVSVVFIFSAIAIPFHLNVAHAGTLSTEEALATRTLGDPNAPVTMIEYSSLGCPHCKSFHTDTLPTLKKEYIDTGKLRIIYNDFPLGNRAMAAAMLARCAPKPAYFGMLELFFDKQDVWSRAQDAIGALASVAKHGMMSRDDVATCLQNQELMNGISNSAQEGTKKYGVRSTPTFVIVEDGNKVIAGAADIAVFRKAIEDALN